MTPLLTLLAAMVAGMLYLGVSAMPAMAASVFDTSPGTAAPPPTLGPYDMTPFEADNRALGQNVTDVPAPGGSVLQFDRSLTHFRIGAGWNTWSHGYTGDVYDTGSGVNQVVMTLPENTKAFYFYVEPAVLGSFNVTATADDGTTSGPIPVEGFAGARYFGFYTTDGSSLSTIQVDADPGADGFAIGEFGIAYGPTDTTPPTVTNKSPDGTVSVSRTATVTATFSEPVQNVTSSTFILERQIAVKKSPPKYVLVDATVFLSDDGLSAELTPVQDLPKGEYRATITTDVTDQADPANALQDPVVWTFTVEN